MEMKALSLKYSNPVLSQIQGCAIFLRYWVKLLKISCDWQKKSKQPITQGVFFGVFEKNSSKIKLKLKEFFEKTQGFLGKTQG